VVGAKFDVWGEVLDDTILARREANSSEKMMQIIVRFYGNVMRCNVQILNGVVLVRLGTGERNVMTRLEKDSLQK
jgi:hypothetical protein